MLTAMRKRLMNQKGFTLIELLVVISIIGVLAAVGVPKFMDTTASARTAKVQAELAAIDSAIQIYGANHAGTLPTETSQITTYMSGDRMPQALPGKYKIGANTFDVAAAVDYGITSGEASIKLNSVDYTAVTLSEATK